MLRGLTIAVLLSIPVYVDARQRHGQSRSAVLTATGPVRAAVLRVVDGDMVRLPLYSSTGIQSTDRLLPVLAKHSARFRGDEIP